ncbi:hypothetical protein V3C99_002439 [Haemonchus contortus]|uniref:Uncharacterized protein n=1 Tax=Haemonchus contortus TaxID=6289 RepID=A0A7I4YC32_HAECO
MVSGLFSDSMLYFTLEKLLKRCWLTYDMIKKKVKQKLFKCLDAFHPFVPTANESMEESAFTRCALTTSTALLRAAVTDDWI